MAKIEKSLKPCSHLHDGDNIVKDEDCKLISDEFEAAVLEGSDYGPAGELEEAPISDNMGVDEIEMCEVAFEFAIPDSWRSSNFSQEKFNADLYRGPRFLFIDARNETSLDANGDKIETERKGQLEGNVFFTKKDQCIPIAPNFTRLRIDAEKNPMLASILYMNGDDIQRDHGANQRWVTEHTTPDGYIDTVMLMDDDLVVRNIYDQWDVMYDFDNAQFMLAVQTHFGGDEEITWDDIRHQRNILLQATDGAISEDMPQSMKDEVIDYRQTLRDLPTALSEFNPEEVPAMFPVQPNSTQTADYRLNKPEGKV